MADASPGIIEGLRKELGLTLEAFAAAVELKSKGQASEIERADRCSAEVALRIELLSQGRVDAASLNPVIAMARMDRPTPQEAAA